MASTYELLWCVAFSETRVVVAAINLSQLNRIPGTQEKVVEITITSSY